LFHASIKHEREHKDRQQRKQPNGTTLNETTAQNTLHYENVLVLYSPDHSEQNIHKLRAWDTRDDRGCSRLFSLRLDAMQQTAVEAARLIH
jgi:hypothetical protein